MKVPATSSVPGTPMTQHLEVRLQEHFLMLALKNVMYHTEEKSYSIKPKLDRIYLFSIGKLLIQSDFGLI